MKKILMISLLLVTVVCGFGMTPLGDYEPPTQTEVLMSTENAVLVSFELEKTTFVVKQNIMNLGIFLELKPIKTADYLVDKIPLLGHKQENYSNFINQRTIGNYRQFNSLSFNKRTHSLDYTNKYARYSYGLIYRYSC